MDINSKLGYVKMSVDRIAEHDDAPETYVAAALRTCRDYIDSRIESLTADRAARVQKVPVEPAAE